MKTNHPAPIGADPVGLFLKMLPLEAKILGAKCYHLPGKVSIFVCYCFNGKEVRTSFYLEGGES
jgi:hypothetical protein